MGSEKFRFRWAVLLGGVLITVTGLVGYGVPAMAQEQPPAATEEEVQAAVDKAFTEEITVTGSLIPRPTLEALSPVATMGIEEITYSGVTRIEDLMATLPQVFSAQNSTIANGASGTATIDLRQLGTFRTLVLIDGRRMAPGDPLDYSADVNFIPAALLKRVDVLTGGASTTYGTDAVSGVVNFILDKEFEGVRGGIQYSFYQHDNDNDQAQAMNAARGFAYPDGDTTDGDGVNLDLAYGSKFADGKGHASVFMTYRNLDAVTKGQRDYLNCAAAQGDEGPVCGGSGGIPEGNFTAYRADGSRIGSFMVGGNGHEFVPRAGRVFNYSPYNHMQRPDERWNGGGFINYQFSDKVEGYADVMFMNDYTDASIAPSGSFNNINQINCDNPLLSEQQRQLICTDAGYGPTDYALVLINRRSVEGSARTNAIRHTSFRMTTGIRGDLNDQWSYDVYGLMAQNNQDDSYQNDLSVERMANAIDVITDPITGEPVCRVGGDCVPWNIFQAGGVTQAAVDYINIVLTRYGTTRTQLLNATMQGDLEDYGWKVPSATEGVQVAFGTEYRTEYIETVPDDNYATGNASGQGGTQEAIEGDLNVMEYFAEVLLPLIQDAPGAHDLSLDLGYRFSDYSTSGAADTWKAQLSYAPTPSFKFRGGLNRAIRSANIFELYRPVGTNLLGSVDPCTNDPATGVPSATLEECMRSGVTAAQYGNLDSNPADQYNNLQGGNLALDPEVADTFTIGLVFTPQAMQGFSATVDYYDIEIAESIGFLSPDGILTTCLSTGDPTLCNLVHRDQYGSLWLTSDGYTITTYQNIGTSYAEGVDLTMSYMFGLGSAGFLNTDIMGTYVLAQRLQNPLQDYDCVGYFGGVCGQPNSDWQHRARVQWDSNFNTSFAVVWRYIGSTDQDIFSPDDELSRPGEHELATINDSAEIGDYNYLDLAATYNFTNGVQFTLGVNNVTDAEPPMLPDLQDNPILLNYSTYDPLGRYVFTSLRFQF